jgi:hypothetical protein
MNKVEDKTKRKILRELTIKAKFLNYTALFSIIIFILLLLRLYPNWEHSKWLFAIALFMECFSIGFFVLTRRIKGILEGDPTDEEIIKWANFLSYYYYPKFIFRKKRNPFIVPDDED